MKGSLRNENKPFNKGINNYTFLSEGADYKQYTTHSSRHSHAKWARRCGADDTTIAEGGRWKDIQSMQRYMQGGLHAALREQAISGVDSITKRWLYRPPC